MEETKITDLPDELILMILQYNCVGAIDKFRKAFPKYESLITSSKSLWKMKFKTMVSYYYFKAVEKHTHGDWYMEMENHWELQTKIMDILSEMTSQHYASVNEVSLNEMKPFFELAQSTPTNYCRVIFILQDHIKISYHYLNNNIGEICCTLTDVYYAKMALRYLFHTYLSMKWVHNFMMNKLDPINVINYFVQWVDPINMHSEEDLNEIMSEFYAIVKEELKKRYLQSNPTHKFSEEDEKLPKMNQIEIINVISHVIYKQENIVIMPNINLETLDIVQVLRRRCGNLFSIGAIYQSTARHFGLNCNLIAFPNHFFLEWQNTDEPEPNLYKIALDSGAVRRKRVCPFSQNEASPTSSKYCPLTLIQYMVMEYNSSMGEVQNWYTRNAELVFNFINSDSRNSPYVNYLHLFSMMEVPSYCNKDITFSNIHPEHLSTLVTLSNMGNASPPIKREVVVHKRSNLLKYAVGMICYHSEFNYVCLIRGWEDSINQRPLQEFRNLKYGHKQPFYIVIAMDQSERYVPQEFLFEYDSPTRLYHLEDMISTEFTHFNGYSYVPNPKKAAEYPEDIAVSSLYKSRFELRMIRVL